MNLGIIQDWFLRLILDHGLKGDLELFSQTAKCVRDSSGKPACRQTGPHRSLAGGEAEGHALLIFKANSGQDCYFFRQ